MAWDSISYWKSARKEYIIQDSKKVCIKKKKSIDIGSKETYIAHMTKKDTKLDTSIEQLETLEMCEVVSRASAFTQQLLVDGANASDVAFALTTVAADMSLQVTGDALQVIPVLMDAIAFQAKRRLDERQEDGAGSDEVCSVELPATGTTIH